MEKNMEKIYLGDWLYNAGIVGFLKIFEFSSSNNKIVRGDNFILFNREIIVDFHEKYFSFVYKKANTINDKVERLKNLLSSEVTKEEDIKKYINSITNSSKTIKNDAVISGLLAEAKESKDWRGIANKLIKALPEHWEKNKDLYSKYYLQDFYEGKSIFNANVKANIREIFQRDFIKPLFISVKQHQKKKIYYCKVCNERIAKKNTFFDEGAFKLSGASANEFKNFYWNLIPNTHLCSLCELIYLCSFAGFSNLRAIGGYRKYLFVNLDTTVDDLYKINNTVENFILPNRENPYKAIIRNMLLDFQQRRSRWTLGNTLFVEFDVEKAPYRIQHFHVPSYVAKLFEGDNYRVFKQLDGFYYKERNDDAEGINILKKIIDNLLSGISLYCILNKTLRDLLLGKHNRSNGLFNIVKIQKSLDIYKIGRDDMKEKVTKKLWSLYYEGQNISKELRDKGSENKIDSIAYKMLSSLRVRDTRSFYDTLLRLYMNLGKEVPATFLETFSPDSVLDAEALGYAFLTGLLGKEYSEHIEKGGNSNE